jgi:proteasome beta subunit
MEVRGDNLQLKYLTLKGTTTIAIVCKDGVILATDTRATAGMFIAHKRVRKVFPIDDHLAMTIAGTLADAQAVLEILKANVRLYKLDKGRPIPVKSAAQLVANILFRARRFPFGLQAIIGGVDDEGPKIFALDPFGSLTEENCFSTGSGSPFALGVLEDGYREDLTVEEGIPLVIRSMTSAMKRDAGSGDSFDVAIVTKEGYRELTEEEKKRYTKETQKEG